MARARIIKKYPNRRLYDTEISAYVTLEDIRQLVIDGEEFEVRDAKTNQDLTRSVLLQIIAEREESGGEPLLSTRVLAQLIRFYGDSMQGLMGTYLERSMQVFMEQQAQLRAQLNNLLGQTPWTLIKGMTERNLELWKDFQAQMLRRSGSSADAPAPPPRGTVKRKP
jgi:polyhydroxyalkanoate synthesis repressor PhaR